MSLQSRVVASIVRSSCPSDRPPIRVADTAKQLEYMQELLPKLRAMGIPAVMYDKGAPYIFFMISVEADLPDFQDGFDDLDLFFESLDVLFFGDTLHIQYGYRDEERVAVSDVEHIQCAADALRVRLTTQAQRRQKTAKVRELKHRFVAARMQELQSRFKFAYRLERLRTKSWLVVDTAYDIDLVAEIPYDAAMPCMEHIEALMIDVHERKRRPKYKHTIRWELNYAGRWWEGQPVAEWDKVPFSIDFR